MMATPQRGDHFDLVVIGTGFASSFFLHRYLQHAPRNARVLALERGEWRDHQWQLANRGRLIAESEEAFDNRSPGKNWVFSMAVGGSSACWWACTPRFLPEDFELSTRYDVGADWPLSYDDLEEYYCDAEELMSVSGGPDAPFPRSRPYPQPPHRLTDPDRRLKDAYPDAFFNQPTARPSRPVSSGRSVCCANGVCTLCPVNSKFTILNELSSLYADDPRVTLRTSAEVMGIHVEAGMATGVDYASRGAEHTVRTDAVALGANALFNPWLLLRSGLASGGVGEGLTEQVSMRVQVFLGGMDNYQGSTSITGHGYMMYGGSHRADRAAALIETFNIPALIDVRGRWRQVLDLKFIFEDLRLPSNVVRDEADASRPVVEYRGHSTYLQRGLDAVESQLANLLKPLPVVDYRVIPPMPGQTESHILGTTVMGRDPEASVIDRDLVHHEVRNLLVLGGGAFPTIAPANPTLTISALSLRAADRWWGRA